MKLLKEIVHFYRFRKISEEKRIIFYAEHKDYYPNFEGIIDELTGKYKETIYYITSDPNDPIFQKTDPLIKAFYIKIFLAFFMSFVKCRVFVMTLTDLNQFHLKRSINPVHYVYVFHSMVSIHMAYLKGAFDYYDSILCVGPYQIKEIRKYEELYKLPAKELVEAGYYRLEKIYSTYQEYLSGKTADEGKTTVLVAPSWGVDNVLESCGEQLVELLLLKGYNVIVRPHPETVRRTPQLINRYDKRFSSNPAFTLERSVASFDSLLKSDILICDLSGVILEYALGTERPVLSLDVPYKIRNKSYKELNIGPFELSVLQKIGTVVSPDELDRVPGVIEKMKSEKEKYRKSIVKLRDENVYDFGDSSKTGAKYIIDRANAVIQNPD